MGRKVETVEIWFCFRPERTTKIKTVSDLTRIGCPGGTNDEKRGKKKEERREMELEEFFDSFGLEKTDDEVEKEDDESGADTGTGFGKEDGDEEEKGSG